MVRTVARVHLAILSCGLLLGCRSTPSCKPPSSFAKALQARIDSQKSFLLEGATDFPWSKVFVFAPYTPVESAAEKASVDPDSLKGSAIAMSDQIALLVFVNNDEFMKCIDQPRVSGDFAGLGGDDGIARADATFTSHPKDGRMVIELQVQE
jgi:hypothetical protein